MPVPAESYFDSAEDVDLFMMAAQKLGYISVAYPGPNYFDWWEWFGDPSQQRRRLRWLIDPCPPVSAGQGDTEVCDGYTAETMAQAACSNAGISRGTDSAVSALRRCCRVWAGYSENPGT